MNSESKSDSLETSIMSGRKRGTRKLSCRSKMSIRASSNTGSTLFRVRVFSAPARWRRRRRRRLERQRSLLLLLLLWVHPQQLRRVRACARSSNKRAIAAATMTALYRWCTRNDRTCLGPGTGPSKKGSLHARTRARELCAAPRLANPPPS